MRPTQGSRAAGRGIVVFDQIGHRRPGRLKDGRKVSERLFGLGFDAVTDSTRSGPLPAVPEQNTKPPQRSHGCTGRALPGAGR
jgi:hypothetical protein